MIHYCFSDCCAGLISAHGGYYEIAAGHLLLLGQRKQSGENHYAQMADRPGVHVFADKPVTEDCIYKRGV